MSTVAKNNADAFSFDLMRYRPQVQVAFSLDHGGVGVANLGMTAEPMLDGLDTTSPPDRKPVDIAIKSNRSHLARVLLLALAQMAVLDYSLVRSVANEVANEVPDFFPYLTRAIDPATADLITTGYCIGCLRNAVGRIKPGTFDEVESWVHIGVSCGVDRGFFQAGEPCGIGVGDDEGQTVCYLPKGNHGNDHKTRFYLKYPGVEAESIELLERLGYRVSRD